MKDYTIAREKALQITGLLKNRALGALLIFTRAGKDPALPLLVNAKTINPAAHFFLPDGNHTLIAKREDCELLEETGIFKKIIPYNREIGEEFLRFFSSLDPSSLALNFSREDHLCDGLSLGLYLQLEEFLGQERLKKIEVSSEPVLKYLRGVKSPTEQKRIRQAVKITCDIYDRVFTRVKPGMTEKEIGELFASHFDEFGVTNGIEGGQSPPMVLITRAGMAHRKPGDTRVQPGDIVVMDASVRYENYCSDIARSLYFLKPGEKSPPEKVTKAFRTVVAAIDASIAALKPGTKGWEVDAEGRRVIEEGGYPTIRHSVGHQVGIACHDGGTRLGPRKPGREDVEGIIQAGEIYAIEPTVLQDDPEDPCFIVEEDVLVRDEGPEILSRRQTELVCIPSN